MLISALLQDQKFCFGRLECSFENRSEYIGPNRAHPECPQVVAIIKFSLANLPPAINEKIVSRRDFYSDLS